MSSIGRRLRYFVVAGFAATIPAGVLAEDAPQQTRRAAIDQDALAGTLLKVRQTGVVTIGHREASVPFSFMDRAGNPIGYSIDICQAIVEEIAHAIDRDAVRIAYVKLTADERIPAVVDGRVDLECGSTTANAERRKSVEFSPMMFVTGTKVLVPATAAWKDFHDLSGKIIGVSKGTTNEQALHKLDEKFALKIKFQTFDDHEAGFAALSTGKIEAYASDEVLLAGLLTRHNASSKFKIAGELLSYEPYGIMFRKGDAQLKDTVDRAFRTLVVARDFGPLYDKWFQARLPGGERIDIPMSPQLEESLELLKPGAEGN